MAEELKVTVQVGSREVIATGTVVTRVNESVVLTLGTLVFNIEFETTDDKKLEAKAEISGGSSLRIKLQNFDNPLGSSYSATVGEFKNRLIGLDLFIHAIGEPNKQRLVSYSFSLEREVKNG